MAKTLPASAYADWLQASVSQHERLAREIISHRGEKGRVVEGVVSSALRDILPRRFSLGTGFAINASGAISNQIDVVVYDHEQNAPLILHGGVGLFPIECVYAAVEVKSDLTRSGVKSAATAIGRLRKIAESKTYVSYGAVSDRGGATW